ncbi:MAG: TRAP transporter large permease [Firmicutes bacterium]|jgi:C4-dicarboxylate transporter DctM subunit|nr:TRAP transporter large permease [Bacillota bacterium]
MATDSLIVLGIFVLAILAGLPISHGMLLTSLVFILVSGQGAGALVLTFSRLLSGFSFSLLAIFLFVTLGILMNETKQADYIVDFFNLAIGRTKGGLGLVTTLSSAACGPLTGSAVGTASAVGSVMYPQMIRRGYSSRFSTALIAYSGILGSLIPPSISGLVYAVIVGLPVLGVWVATAGVGLLYLALLSVTTVIVSRMRGYGGGDRAATRAELVRAFLKALPAGIVPLCVLGSIYLGIATPTEAGAIGIVASLLLGALYYKTLTSFGQVRRTMYRAACVTAVVMFLVCASFALSYALTITGSVKAIARAALLLTSNKYLLLLLTGVLLVILGCFMDDSAIMVLLAPIATSILGPAGIHPYHLAAYFTSVCLLGLVTPPVGTVLYSACAISKEPLPGLMKDILVFFIPALALILMITFIPGISLFLPRLFGFM